MEFLLVTLYVSDLEKTIGFYEDIVGLKTESRFSPAPALEIVFLSDGKSQTKLELISSSESPQVTVGKDYSLGFKVDSADAMMDMVKEKNIPLASEMISPQPNVKFFFVLDPDGRKVQFVENM